MLTLRGELTVDVDHFGSKRMPNWHCPLNLQDTIGTSVRMATHSRIHGSLSLSFPSRACLPTICEKWVISLRVSQCAVHACVEDLHPGAGCRNQRNQHRNGQRQRQSSKLLVAVVIEQAAASPSPSQSSSQSPGRRQPHLPCTCSAWSTHPAESQPGEDSAESGMERFARDNAGLNN